MVIYRDGEISNDYNLISALYFHATHRDIKVIYASNKAYRSSRKMGVFTQPFPVYTPTGWRDKNLP